MGANVRPVDDGDLTLVSDAIREARARIEARGYQPIWGKGGESDPLNISEALAGACDGNNNLYVRARQSFSKNWGGPLDGLLNWETEKRRSKAEVLEVFDQVLDRLENGEAHPTIHKGRSRAGGGRGTRPDFT